MSETSNEILERLSFFIFLGAVEYLIIFAAAKYFVTHFNQKRSGLIHILKWALFFLLLLFTIFSVVTEKLNNLYQNIGLIASIFGLLITILTFIYALQNDNKLVYLKIFLFSFVPIFFSVILYIISSINFHNKIPITDPNYFPQKYLSVYSFVGYYKGTIKTKNIGELHSILDIRKIVSTQDEIFFEYSITTSSKNDLLNYKGHGKIILDKEMLEFTGFTTCEYAVNKDTLTLVSKYPDENIYWQFRGKIK